MIIKTFAIIQYKEWLIKMNFKNGKELLDLCENNNIKISEVMRQRECELGETTFPVI